MDSDKPSNPSDKTGSADDLIEEMARLMANDAQDSKTAPAASTAPTSQSPTSSTPESGTRADSGRSPAGGAAGSPTFGAQQQNVPRPAPEPVSVPRDDASSESGGSTPGWLPSSRHKREEPKSTAPERQEPSFQTGQSVQTQTEQAAKSEPSRFDFGVTREQDKSVPTPERRHEQVVDDAVEGSGDKSGFDFDFGIKASSEETPVTPEAAPQAPVRTPPVDEAAPADPIADLIRHQMDAKPAAPVDANPESQPERAGRDDNFNVAPVFGLGSENAERSMGGSDALDDIENLIGNAVRVDMPTSEQPAEEPQGTSEAEHAVPQPAPVPQPPVRPHQSQQATRQTPAGDVDAAEAAILAALSSTGGQSAEQPQAVGARQPEAAQATTYAEPGFDSDFGDEAPVMAEGASRRKSGFRWGRVVLPIAALLLLGVIGYAGYMFLTSTPPEGEAPVLVADSEPSRQVPEADTADGADESVVFSDDTATDGSDEQLVSRDQSQDSGGDDAIRQIITADTTENGLANRKVRTVTVRPDGTIISGEDIVAGSEALPVERPEVSELPADAVTSDLANTDVSGLNLDELGAGTPEDLAASDAENLVSVNGASVPFPAARPDNLATLRSTSTPSNSAPLANQPAATPPPAVTQQQPAVTSNPQPATEQPGTVDLLGSVEPQDTPAVNASPEVTTAAAPSVEPASAAAWVQLASQPDEAVANSEAGRLSRLYSSALGGRDLVVRQADLGDRGVWYRVLVPASSMSDAQNLCVQIQNAGGDCFPRNN